MAVPDKAVPNIVGVDISCGMYTVFLPPRHTVRFNITKTCNIPRCILFLLLFYSVHLRTAGKAFLKNMNLQNAVRCVKIIVYNYMHQGFATNQYGGFYYGKNSDKA